LRETHETDSGPIAMRHYAPLAFSVAVYLLFHAVFAYLVGFATNLCVPRSVDVGPAAPFAAALAMNVALIAGFGVQHTVMARRGFQRRLARYLPVSLERTVFVLSACVMIGLLCWNWRPMPQVVWDVGPPGARAVVTLFSLAGWTMVPSATFLLGHFEFTGVQQAWRAARGRKPRPPRIRTWGMHRHLRHPMPAGVLLGVWCAPTMTVGHLVLALGLTMYITIHAWFEGRDMAVAPVRRTRAARQPEGSRSGSPLTGEAGSGRLVGSWVGRSCCPSLRYRFGPRRDKLASAMPQRQIDRCQVPFPIPRGEHPGV
jgi:protein-S-isoprenylcysteine O-methyltransferase Ste14